MLLVAIVIALLAVLVGFIAYGALTVRGQRRALAGFRTTAQAYFTLWAEPTMGTAKPHTGALLTQTIEEIRRLFS